MLATILGTLAVQLVVLLLAAAVTGFWVNRGDMNDDRSFSLSLSFDRRGYTGWGFFSLGRDTYMWVRALTLGVHQPCLESQYDDIGDHIHQAWETGYNRGKRDGLEDGFEEAVWNFETFGHPNPRQRRTELQYGRPDLASLAEAAASRGGMYPPDMWDTEMEDRQDELSEADYPWEDDG